MAAGGQVHHIVGAPADRPDQLVHFLAHARGHGAVADIGVDLGQEVAADDHRLGFGMVDVGGNDRPAARDFGAHEFRRDLVRDRRAEAVAIARQGAAPQVFARRDIFHFLGNNTLTRVMDLGDVAARLGAQQLDAAAVELRHGQLFTDL